MVQAVKRGRMGAFILEGILLVDYIRSGHFLARLLILIKKGGLLQLKFGVVGVGVVGVGVNIYLWAR